MSVGHFFEQKLVTFVFQYVNNSKLFRIEEFLSQETNTEHLKLKKALLDWFIKWEKVDTGVDDLKNQVKKKSKR